MRCVDHVWLTPDNNRAENAIGPFVIGRKDWLYRENYDGVAISSRFYRLTETAKANGLEPGAFLNTTLDPLPKVRLSADWE